MWPGHASAGQARAAPAATHQDADGRPTQGLLGHVHEVRRQLGGGIEGGEGELCDHDCQVNEHHGDDGVVRLPRLQHSRHAALQSGGARRGERVGVSSWAALQGEVFMPVRHRGLPALHPGMVTCRPCRRLPHHDGCWLRGGCSDSMIARCMASCHPAASAPPCAAARVSASATLSAAVVVASGVSSSEPLLTSVLAAAAAPACRLWGWLLLAPVRRRCRVACRGEAARRRAGRPTAGSCVEEGGPEPCKAVLTGGRAPAGSGVV